MRFWQNEEHAHTNDYWEWNEQDLDEPYHRAREDEQLESIGGIPPMPSIYACFPSKYLKAADFEKDTLLTIHGVSMEQVDQNKPNEMKPVLFFRECEAGLVLNKTNATTIVEWIGTDDYDQWKGHQIVAFPAKTDFGGRQVDCIRLREPKFKNQATNENFPPPRTEPDPPGPEPGAGPPAQHAMGGQRQAANTQQRIIDEGDSPF